MKSSHTILRKGKLRLRAGKLHSYTTVSGRARIIRQFFLTPNLVHFKLSSHQFSTVNIVCMVMLPVGCFLCSAFDGHCIPMVMLGEGTCPCLFFTFAQILVTFPPASAILLNTYFSQ